MKICIIAGSRPPQVCGVGDFTAALADRLRTAGAAVTIKHRDPWTLRAIPQLVRELRIEKPDVVHLQYPAHGFRRSVVPHLLHLSLLRWPRLTTLHDYAGQRWPIQLSMSTFAWAGHIVVNGSLDHRAFIRRHPWMAPRVSVIPIGSNIPGGIWEPAGPFTIVHFGMLRPGKGVEDMIQLARLCKRTGRPYRTLVVGAVVPHARDYAESLFRAAADTNLEWQLDLPPDRVSDILRHCHAAYLAPPFGVHERRGTLLACAANGLPIVAKVGWETPAFLKDYLVPAGSPEEALSAIDAIADPERLAKQSALSVTLAGLFSWDSITSRYLHALAAAASRGIPSAPPIAGSEVRAQ